MSGFGFSTGTRVQISGLQGAAELNGKQGLVNGEARESGRITVDIDGVGEKKLKPQNLSKIVKGGVFFPAGTRVKVSGLTGAAHLNGKEGNIVRKDEASGRYTVDIDGEGEKNLKPENLVLDSKANVVKLIDFGCAQSIGSLRPRSHCYESTEFLPPELLTPNSQKIGTHTDMWAFGVLLYVALSGLSPFLDDSQDETNNNILRGDFSFPDEYFAKLSGDAKDLIGRILCVNTSSRASSKQCLEMSWFSLEASSNSRIPTTHLTTFVRRRKKKLNSITLLGITPSPTRSDGMPDSSFQPSSSNSRILHHHKSPHY